MTDKKEGYKTFSALETGSTAEGGLRNAALITVGPAINHDCVADARTLETVVECLGEKPLKSYDSHCRAWADSVGDILGFFEGFAIDGDRVVARKFSFRPSADAKSRASIEECASIAPQSIGLSLNGMTNLVWVMGDGTEIDYWSSMKRPEGALGEYPSIRFTEIFSCDFVGSPAANPNGLYDAQAATTQPKETDMANKKLAYFAAKYAADSAKLARAALKLSADENATEEEIEKQVESETELEDLKEKLAALEARCGELEKKLEAAEAGKSESDKKLEDAEKELSALKGMGHFGVGNPDDSGDQRKLSDFEARYSALIEKGDTAGAAKLARDFGALGKN